MTKTIFFATMQAAEAVMAPLYAGGKISTWSACRTPRGFKVRYCAQAIWRNFTNIDATIFGVAA